MIYKKLVLLILLGFLSRLVYAQTAAEFKWWNPLQSNFPVVAGQAWPSELKESYWRFPTRAQVNVNAEVWKLSQQSAGLSIHFKTNAEQITIRYQVDGPLAMPHMPATGVSGIDLFGLDTKGNYLWCAGKYSFKDTIQYKFINLKPINTQKSTGIEYILYLPLYNSVKWLEIGTPIGDSFTALPVTADLPVIVYGTSITQGACASRPGMAWTNILSRKLNVPIINLGFSGTGRLDKAVIDLINEKEARVYVLDCLPNMVGGSAKFTGSEIYSRLTDAVKQIRVVHVKTPIILTDHFGYTDAMINPVKREEYLMVNRINHQAFADLKKQGVKNIYLLPIEALHQDMDTMVDGIHPTDLGMMRYAEAYQVIITKILAGKFSEK